jgi:hypothetical protein
LKPEARKWLFELVDSLVSSFETLLTEGCETGEFKISDVRLLAYDIVASSFMWGLHRWYLRKHFTLKKYTQKQSALFLSVAVGTG